MHVKPVLIIFTEGHPDIDTSFILPELLVIHQQFERIDIYPYRWKDSVKMPELPANVNFYPDLAKYVKRISSLEKKFQGFISKQFWSLVFKIKPSKVKSLLNTSGLLIILSKWIEEHRNDNPKTIYYTYWLTPTTAALANLKRKGKINHFVSRAHRFDLYDERGDMVMNLMKPQVFSQISRLFVISADGYSYLLKRYGSYSGIFRISRLGTFNSGNYDSSNIIHNEIVSCSFLSPVKRVELLIRAIESFQKKYPEIELLWTHIGSGELYDSLFEFAKSILNEGSFNFTGSLTHNEVLRYYTNHNPGCFINVSESEGLPVSIMEAQSFGIPVIATSVGGTPEIVNNENGLLLPVDADPEEIASAIYVMFSNVEVRKRRSSKSRINWEENFNAEKNYQSFSKELLEIVNH